MQHHVLVIDDDPSVLSVLKRGLHYEGFTVAIASSGHAGLDLARERPPDLVILDLMMPELDGFTVLQRLRNADADLPVLLLTGKDAPADQIQGFTAGADDYHSDGAQCRLCLTRGMSNVITDPPGVLV
jgi:two-component system response regulator MprA